MRIKITKSLVFDIQDSAIENHIETLFSAGEYLANLTPEGKIEVINTRMIKTLLSFSQFREKVSLGEFIVVEA